MQDAGAVGRGDGARRFDKPAGNPGVIVARGPLGWHRSVRPACRRFQLFPRTRVGPVLRVGQLRDTLPDVQRFARDRGLGPFLDSARDLVEVAAADVGHDVVIAVALAAGGVDGHQVGMMEFGADLPLVAEPLAVPLGADAANDLDDGEAVERRLDGEVRLAHPAARGVGEW